MEWVRGDQPDRAWLGLDLDDGYLARQPFDIGATLLGVPAEASTDPGVAVWVTVRYARSGERVQQHRMSSTNDSGEWTATVDPLAPGAYRIVVEAVNVPGCDKVTCSDILAAVDVP